MSLGRPYCIFQISLDLDLHSPGVQEGGEVILDAVGKRGINVRVLDPCVPPGCGGF